MANHSFSRLTANIGRNYFVTNDTKSKLNLQYCPCSKNCSEQIIFDSTGIGSEFLWYGRPDIMMLPTCPMGGVSGIIVPEQSEDEDDKLIQEFCPELENHKSVVEVKPSYSLRVEKKVQQIVSIAITFSMFQNPN